MNKRIIYCLSVDYGADMFDLCFADETIRNEMALAYAQEIELANFNLNVAAWMGQVDEETAIRWSLAAEPWSYAHANICNWEAVFYDYEE